MIGVANLQAAAGEFRLRDVSFTVPTGAWGVVIGPAGSGKTTLLESIAGVVSPLAGVVTIGARDVTRAPVNERRVGLVYQHAYLFPHLSVRDNVAYGASSPSVVAAVIAALAIDPLGARDVASLSGGERQLVALARALAQEPEVLLLDEPFSALDPKRRSITRRVVRDWHRARETTVLQVTHDFAEAGLLGDVTVLLDGGRVLQAGPSAEVFRRPVTPYVAEFLGAENVLSGAVVGDTVVEGAPRAVEFHCGPLAFVAISDAPVGACHAVIRGEEVILSRAAQSSSARNSFAGTVTEVALYGAYARVTVAVQGVPLVALLTLPSLRDLALEPGAAVHASFKAFAVHLC
ncbi:MAG: ABC transporter ATP-binding protein [Gemmatimonadetes bacterium]|nr:ABC transporter ATP-binding protein [Gemmatimonadota bacterium]